MCLGLKRVRVIVKRIDEQVVICIEKSPVGDTLSSSKSELEMGEMDMLREEAEEEEINPCDNEETRRELDA